MSGLRKFALPQNQVSRDKAKYAMRFNHLSKKVEQMNINSGKNLLHSITGMLRERGACPGGSDGDESKRIIFCHAAYLSAMPLSQQSK